MTAWNRDSVVKWFRGRPQHQVRVARSHDVMRLEGRCCGVEELDACSADYLECGLDVGIPGVEVALSFHDEVLLVHLYGVSPRKRGTAFSVPVSIPYEQLQLSEPTLAQTDGPGRARSTAEEEEEPAFSPYELLH